MRIEGTADLSGTPETVFDRLLDRELLARCNPGCESLEEVGTHRYEASLRIGVGAVTGTFKATFSLTDLTRPQSYRLSIEGRSSVGHARGSAFVSLHRTDSGTRLTYEGEARVAGLIAAVGQRLLALAARRMATAFFDNLAHELG